MAKLATDAMIDGGLDKFATCTKLTVCAGQPTSYADIAARELASVAIDGADFTKANGDTSGRKVTVAQQASLSITSDGTADHIAIDNGVADYVITTCTAQGLTSGGTVTVPAHDHEISDPA
jgi:hypothetical protein